MNRLIIIPLAMTLVLEGLLGGTILKEDAGLTDLKCNRYFLASFTEVEWRKEFAPFKSTRAIRDICKTIKDSCCSVEEMVEFRKVYREKKEVIMNVQTSAKYLYKILEQIPASMIHQRCLDSEECMNTLQIRDDFDSTYDELLARKDAIIERVDKFLDFVIKYYSGMVCTACDLQLNQFFYTKQTNEGEELGYVYKIDNCFDIYNKIKELLPAISDFMFLINVVKIYQITGAPYLQGLNFDLDDFQNLTDFTKDLSVCFATSKDELLKSKYCKEICSGSFTLIKFSDPQKVFQILEKILYAFERVLIESLSDDPEVMKNEIKILQFSDGMELVTPDRKEEEFVENAEAFSWYYQQPDSAPYNLLDAYIHFDVDGIAPHLVALNSNIFSSLLVGLLFALLVK